MSQKPDRIKFEILNKDCEQRTVFADQVALGPTGQLVFTTHVEVGLNINGEMEYEPVPSLILQPDQYVSCMVIKNGTPLFEQSGKISTLMTN